EPPHQTSRSVNLVSGEGACYLRSLLALARALFVRVARARPLDQLGHRLGGESPALDPMLDPVVVQADFDRLARRIVNPYLLDEPTVPRAAGVGHHDPVIRRFLRARAGQSQPDGHSATPLYLLVLYHEWGGKVADHPDHVKLVFRTR